MKKITRILGVLLFSSLSSVGFGSSFFMNQEIAHLPIMNQGTLGTCYANSASVVHAGFYSSSYPGKIFSPLYLALNASVRGHKNWVFRGKDLSTKIGYMTPVLGWGAYLVNKFERRSETLLDRVTGGSFCSTLEDINNLTFCGVEEVEGFLDANPYLYTEKIKSLEQLIAYYAQRKSFAHLNQSSFLKHPINREALRELDIFLSKRGVSKRAILRNMDIKKTLFHFFENRCQQKGYKPVSSNLKCEETSLRHHTRDELFSMMDARLMRKNTSPVVINYCFGSFMGEKRCMHHSSVVLGRSEGEKGVFYLMRNSFGGQNIFDILKRGSAVPVVQDIKNAPQQFIDNELMGDFWVHRDALKQAFSIEYNGISVLW